MTNKYILLCILFCLGSAGHCATLNERLRENLLCENDPSGAVGWLNPRVGEDSPEAKIISSGEEIEYRIDVRLETPINVEGATTRDVSWQVEGGPEPFGAIIFAEFRGSHKTVAERLELRPSANEEFYKGVQIREVPDGSLCPPTIMLKPISKTRFLLGCGWCNGG